VVPFETSVLTGGISNHIYGDGDGIVAVAENFQKIRKKELKDDDNI
jgi:hypothetical protein